MNSITYDSLSIIIPVYNSMDTIGPLVDTVFELVEPKFSKLEVILVNDGSQDGSHAECMKIIEKYKSKVHYLQLARNFGEHNAVLCGLNHVSCECVAIIDDDFQNPPEEIFKLVEVLGEGYDVVYSYYEKKRHSWFRNLGSRFNDLVACCMLKKPRGLYLSSFKVMNRFLSDVIVSYQGPYPYIDGLILRSTNSIGTCQCEHSERQLGKSNYTLTKLVRLWLNMFTSFSILPLRASSIAGLVLSGFGALLTFFFLLSYLTDGVFFSHPIPPGWASTIILATFFSGFQLCILGLLGEYLGRMYLTINKQPQFIVRRHFLGEEEK